ncbi:ANTAR domain-containing protein [Micromonospora sp. NPDC018662]|uniref:GAF and ANTAR domain-containing protein n=1 Tax=Micromonospora sp. NPDC018662 TaxID=3364238 RepID=UPI0037AA8319
MSRPPTDPADVFAELSGIKLGEVDLDDVLQHVADLATRVLPTPVEVWVTLVRGGTGHTPVSTHNPARGVNERQYAHARRPCREAAASVDILPVSDPAAEDRRPDRTERGSKTGMGSFVSIGLPMEGAVVGALNVYARTPHTFDDDTIEILETFATYAAVALANTHLYDITATLARRMQETMAGRVAVEQAKGIIMAERHCTPTEAFAILTKVSQDADRPIGEAAQAMVDRRPEVRPRPDPVQ